MKPYTLNPDLFTNQLQMIRTVGSTGWDFEELCVIVPNAVERPGEASLHLALRECREYASSVPGESVDTFADRLFQRISLLLNPIKPPVEECRSLGLFH